MGGQDFQTQFLTTMQRQTLTMERAEARQTDALDRKDRGVKSLALRHTQAYNRMSTENGHDVGNGATALAKSLLGKTNATEAIDEVSAYLRARNCPYFGCSKKFVTSMTQVTLGDTHPFAIPAYSIYHCGTDYTGDEPVITRDYDGLLDATSILTKTTIGFLGPHSLAATFIKDWHTFIAGKKITIRRAVAEDEHIIPKMQWIITYRHNKLIQEGHTGIPTNEVCAAADLDRLSIEEASLSMSVRLPNSVERLLTTDAPRQRQPRRQQSQQPQQNQQPQQQQWNRRPQYNPNQQRQHYNPPPSLPIPPQPTPPIGNPPPTQRPQQQLQQQPPQQQSAQEVPHIGQPADLVALRGTRQTYVLYGTQQFHRIPRGPNRCPRTNRLTSECLRFAIDGVCDEDCSNAHNHIPIITDSNRHLNMQAFTNGCHHRRRAAEASDFR